ncbi:AAA family ATPase [Actinomadura decatromicini]|uniref:AAA family ATPase n=2 Tax=Actinomadura decatromicini TaxID=2604572 RepID=A0A5D3FZX7_9ACTN|nr:AAA family ATPase [Actinomadura decatromicini]
MRELDRGLLMRLVERDNDLRMLADAFAGQGDGDGSLALISGAPATGKTALLQEFAEQVREVGAVFLEAIASRTEQGQPLGVIAQLFHGMELPAETTEHVARLIDEGVHSAARAGSPEHPPTGTPPHVLRGLCNLILHLAENRQVIIGIDDVHYADPFSLECLLYLVRRMRTTRLLIILSQCDRRVQGHYLQFRAELSRQPHCRTIRLGLLSEQGVAGLLETTYGRSAALRLAPTFHALSGGNPLLVHALLDDHLPTSVAEGSVSSEVPLGDAFTQAVTACLYRCGSETMQVARALNLLGEEVAPAALAEVLDLDPESVGRAVGTLTAVGLLTGGRFRHDAVRSAISDTITAADRAATHRRAARVLHDHGASVTVLAQHLLGADQVDEPWVVPVLEDAAQEALQHGAIGRALEFLRRAHDLATNDEQRAALKAALVRAEWRVSPSAAARHLPELILHAQEGRLSWQDVSALIGHLIWHGRLDEVVGLLTVLERRPAQGTPGDEAQVGLETLRLWVCCLFPEHLGALRPDWSVPQPAGLVSFRALGQLRAADVLTDALDGDIDDNTVVAAEQVLQGAQWSNTPMASTFAAVAALIFAGELDKAALWCDALIMTPANRHALAQQALLWAIRGAIEVRQGRMAAAETSARTALNLISPQDWGMFIGLPVTIMLVATTALGKYLEAARYLAMPVPEVLLRTPLGLHYMQARGRCKLATDNGQAALGDFEMCGELMVKWGLDLPILVPWRTDAARALLAMGRRRQARGLVHEQLARLTSEHAQVRGVSLGVLAAASDPVDRLPLLKDAVATLDRCGDRWELARALAALSQAHQMLGQRAEAAETAARARRLAEECGVPEEQLSPIHIPPPEMASDVSLEEEEDDLGGGHSPEELSGAERRVADLAARGHTNRQIASILFITVSTVEQHLTRVYRKLNVNRRSDLPGRLRTGAEEPELAAHCAGPGEHATGRPEG